MARVVIDTRAFTDEVEGVLRRAQDCRTPLKAWAAYMVGSVKRNFAAEGRPVKWAPLKVATLLARYLRTAGAKKLMAAAGWRPRYAPNPAVFKDDVRGAGAVSTVDGFFRSTKTGKILRTKHKGFNKIAKLGMSFRKAALRAVMQGKILQDTGRLRSSISSELLGKHQVAVGTNVVYAAAQQFGNPKTNNPARPFAVIQAEDDAEFVNLTTDWVFGRWGR